MGAFTPRNKLPIGDDADQKPLNGSVVSAEITDDELLAEADEAALLVLAAEVPACGLVKPALKALTWLLSVDPAVYLPLGRLTSFDEAPACVRMLATERSEAFLKAGVCTALVPETPIIGEQALAEYG